MEATCRIAQEANQYLESQIPTAIDSLNREEKLSQVEEIAERMMQGEVFKKPYNGTALTYSRECSDYTESERFKELENRICEPRSVSIIESFELMKELKQIIASACLEAAADYLDLNLNDLQVTE
jgi:hypothetical protein